MGVAENATPFFSSQRNNLPRNRFGSELERTTKFLTSARSRIEKGWCQGAYARTHKGTECGYKAPAATQFCAEGALYAVSPDPNMEIKLHRIMHEALGIPLHAAISNWNDDPARTHEDVLALYDVALEQLAAKCQK